MYENKSIGGCNRSCSVLARLIRLDHMWATSGGAAQHYSTSNAKVKEMINSEVQTSDL